MLEDFERALDIYRDVVAESIMKDGSATRAKTVRAARQRLIYLYLNAGEDVNQRAHRTVMEATE